MDFATFFAVGAAMVPIMLTIIVCTVKASSAIGRGYGEMKTEISLLDTSIKTLGKKQDHTHEFIEIHSKECDLHRLELNIRTEQHDQKQKEQTKTQNKQTEVLNDHNMRITGLEKA